MWTVVTAGLSITGCADEFGAIDAQMRDLMEQRTSLINSSDPPTYRSEPVIKGLDDPALTSKRPPTVNPGPEELTFKPADEGRDVAARLASFQAIDEAAARHMTLFDALRQAQQTGREHLTAQEDYMLAAIRLMMERHLWGPRFFDDMEASFHSQQVDGSTTAALDIINQLRATQRLPYGGQVEAQWVWQATENLRSAATEQYVQSSSLSLDASIPLLRGAGLFAQEDLIQAERNLIYAARDYEQFRRSYLVDIAGDYFQLLQQLANITNTEKQLEGFRRIEVQQEALYEAGRIRQMDVNNAANQVRQAEDSLANQKDSYTLALDRFKVRLGIPVTTPIVIDPSELLIPEPDVSMEDATAMALEYRLDLQNRRDAVEDSRRSVKNAKQNLLPDLELAGNVTLPTDASAREGGAVYEPDDVQYGASAKLSLPLDRRNEKLSLRQATILEQRSERDFERFRDEVVLDVRAKVREIDLARNSLRLSTERVALTRRRQEEQSIKQDEFTTQEKLDTENDLLAAENARSEAVTNLRNAVLQYLLATGQLRVTREGELRMLPGMAPPTPAPAPESAPATAPPPANPQP